MLVSHSISVVPQLSRGKNHNILCTISATERTRDMKLPNRSSCLKQLFAVLGIILTLFVLCVDGFAQRLAYNAVWRFSTADEIQEYEVSESRIRSRYRQLSPSWHLHILQSYVVGDEVVYNAVWREGRIAETYLLAATRDEVAQRYRDLWYLGWRLHILQAYVLRDRVLYNAVWRASVEEEALEYGLTYEEFRVKYDTWYVDGWRLHIFQSYSVNSRQLYNVVWRRNSEPETWAFNFEYQRFLLKNEELAARGWRLYILDSYVVGGQVLYNAIWHSGRGAEIQVHRWSYNNYRHNYDRLWDEGWRLAILQGYVDPQPNRPPHAAVIIRRTQETKAIAPPKIPVRVDTVTEFDKLPKVQQTIHLSEYGPFLPIEYRMDDINMRVFIRGGWQILVSYSLRAPSASITIELPGVANVLQLLPSGENKLVIIEIPSRFGDRPTIGKLSIQTEVKDRSREPFQLFAIGVVSIPNNEREFSAEPVGFNTQGLVGPTAPSSLRDWRSLYALQKEVPVDNISLRPDLIRTSQHESVKYKFRTTANYSKAEAKFFLYTLVNGVATPKRVFLEHYGRIGKNQEAPEREWDGKTNEGNYSYGVHKLNIFVWKPWTEGGDWFGPVLSPPVRVTQ